MKKTGSIFLLYFLLYSAVPAFAQQDLALVQKVQNLEAAMSEKDQQTAEMKKMIPELSQTVESFRKISPQAAADQAVPLVTEPVATGVSSNKIIDSPAFTERGTPA